MVVTPGPALGRRRPQLDGEPWQRWWRDQAVDQVTNVASEQGFVLSTRDLAAPGVTRAEARTAVRRGRWQAPAVGVVAPLDPGDPSVFLAQRRCHALAASAVALRRRDHVVSGRSAAVLHGLPTLRVPAEPELTSRRAGLGARPSLHAFGASLGADEITSWFGAPVTDVARTVVDLARHDRRDGLMAADAALRERLVSRAELGGALDRARGWPGVRGAREVVAFADPGADSALESLVRLALHEDGFPAPQLQVRIGPYWTDFCWPAARLVIEADGRTKYSADTRWAEKRREVAIGRSGWFVERALWSDLFAGWPAFAGRLWPYFRGT